MDVLPNDMWGIILDFLVNANIKDATILTRVCRKWKQIISNRVNKIQEQPLEFISHFLQAALCEGDLEDVVFSCTKSEKIFPASYFYSPKGNGRGHKPALTFYSKDFKENMSNGCGIRSIYPRERDAILETIDILSKIECGIMRISTTTYYSATRLSVLQTWKNPESLCYGIYQASGIQELYNRKKYSAVWILDFKRFARFIKEAPLSTFSKLLAYAQIPILA